MFENQSSNSLVGQVSFCATALLQVVFKLLFVCKPVPFLLDFFLFLFFSFIQGIFSTALRAFMRVVFQDVPVLLSCVPFLLDLDFKSPRRVFYAHCSIASISFLPVDGLLVSSEWPLKLSPTSRWVE